MTVAAHGDYNEVWTDNRGGVEVDNVSACTRLPAGRATKGLPGHAAWSSTAPTVTTPFFFFLKPLNELYLKRVVKVPLTDYSQGQFYIICSYLKLYLDSDSDTKQLTVNVSTTKLVKSVVPLTSRYKRGPAVPEQRG